MAPVRSSNVERSKWRSKCREELSRHIRDRVGIFIEPAHVRLIPGTDDPYTWKVLPEKRHLFSKNISEHSIGAYKELCEGIGIAFEAAPVSGKGSTGTMQALLVSTEPTQVSFSARIDELQGENTTLKRDLEQWKVQASVESELRQQFEQELKSLTIDNQILRQDLQKSQMVADCFKSDIYKYIRIVNGVMPLMDELKAGLVVNGESCEVDSLLCPVVQSHT